MTVGTDLENAIAALVDGMNFSLVEMSIGRHRGSIKVNLVLHKEGGISLDDLTTAQKVIRPRLEIEFKREDLSLEISSPGVSRKIKSHREYAIFIGQPVRILVDDGWVTGLITGADETSVDLDTGDGPRKVQFVDIRKGKLD